MPLPKLKITRLAPNKQEDIHHFLSDIFNAEQRIPIEKIPIKSDMILWWGIVDENDEVLGTAATWKEEDNWHWGRFAVHSKMRWRGLGKELARVSLTETFEQNIDSIIIDARDFALTIIQRYGGVINGEKTRFFSEDITPMILEKTNFTPFEDK